MKHYRMQDMSVNKLQEYRQTNQTVILPVKPEKAANALPAKIMTILKFAHYERS